jgi:hypothetical protein
VLGPFGDGGAEFGDAGEGFTSQAFVVEFLEAGARFSQEVEVGVKLPQLSYAAHLDTSET